MSWLVALLILYIIWDVNYFIRCVFTVLAGKLFQKKRKITDKTTIYGKMSDLIISTKLLIQISI